MPSSLALLLWASPDPAAAVASLPRIRRTAAPAAATRATCEARDRFGIAVAARRAIPANAGAARRPFADPDRRWPPRHRLARRRSDGVAPRGVSFHRRGRAEFRSKPSPLSLVGDAIHALAVLGLRRRDGEPKLLLECAGHGAAHRMSLPAGHLDETVMVAPPGRRSIVINLACLVSARGARVVSFGAGWNLTSP
jgi:hypothetical protein